VSLFQRIKTPFGEPPEDPGQPEWRVHAVGRLLRDRRQELGLDLEAAGDALCIKPIYLDALEQGRTYDLPGPTYAIGFIRAYAHYLGFDGERVLERYKAESSDVHLRPDLSLPVPLGERSLPGLPILLVGLILALCGYGTWYYLSTGERGRPERVPPVPAELQQAAPLAALPPVPPAVASGASAPTGAPPLAAGLDAPASPRAAGNAAVVTSPPAVAPASPAGDAVQPAAAAPADQTAVKDAGQIDIRATADCWIQVRAPDQSIVFSRVLKAGETYHVPRPGLLLRTGNAGALAITVDGKPAPAIGSVGALRRSVALDPEALLAGTAAHG
jgi:cytoskeleton protein RodZ